MDWNKFEEDIKNCRFDFTEEQLRNLKSSCTEMYRILKFVFDSPRKLVRPYNSLERYKFEKERVYQSPSEYYHYRDNENQIQLWKRRNGYSVAVCGPFRPDGVNFEAFIGHEKKFSQGFNFYGLFTRDRFTSAVYCYNFIVRQYIQQKFDSEALF